VKFFELSNYRLDMKSLNSFFYKYLIFFFLGYGIAEAQPNCMEVKATIEVLHAGQMAEKASVFIDFHGHSRTLFQVTLLGTKGFYRKEIQEEEIKNLYPGKYMLVFTSRNEEDRFCIKHLEFTIK
jgi:hypothetical protein